MKSLSRKGIYVIRVLPRALHRKQTRRDDDVAHRRMEISLIPSGPHLAITTTHHLISSGPRLAITTTCVVQIERGAYFLPAYIEYRASIGP